MASKDQSLSYSQILKASAIVGGAQGLDIVVRMVRIKLIAILLGPSGVGLIGLFQTTVEFIGKISGLGVSSSAVRHVADVRAKGDAEEFGRVWRTLANACLLTGLAGWLLTALLARHLSLWTLQSPEWTGTFTILGSVVFFNTIFEGQKALLQGCRRIAELAKVMVYSSAMGTIVSVALYAWLGQNGIVIAMPVCAIVNLCISRWFLAGLAAPTVKMTLHEMILAAYPIFSLGLAFMWAGILNTGVTFIVKGMVVRGFGIDGGGIYQAAWGLSGLFAGFILNAMSKDFYPRLTSVANQNDHVNQLVNEQIEVGILIAMPGLLATLAFSPLAISLFYTADFMQAAELLPWLVLGVFGQIISWPMGFIQLAKGAGITFAITETVSSIFRLLFVWLGKHYLGLMGVAVAYAVFYAWYIVFIYGVAFRMTKFSLSRDVLLLICLSISFIFLEFVIARNLTGIPKILASVALIALCSGLCVNRLVVRLGPDHRISRMFATFRFFFRADKR